MWDSGNTVQKIQLISSVHCAPNQGTQSIVQMFWDKAADHLATVVLVILAAVVLVILAEVVPVILATVVLAILPTVFLVILAEVVLVILAAVVFSDDGILGKADSSQF